jgi:DNA mismatch endonuclease, patch repair protein
MKATPGHDNPRERSLRSELHRRGLRFRLHRPLLRDMRRTADIVFPTVKLAIFLDGCFWHGCPLHVSWPKRNAAWWREKIETNRHRDRDTDQRLAAEGWIVIRVWEHNLIGDAADRIAQLLAVLSGSAATATNRQNRSNRPRRSSSDQIVACAR